jgi:hypothetical protein
MKHNQLASSPGFYLHLQVETNCTEKRELFSVSGGEELPEIGGEFRKVEF